VNHSVTDQAKILSELAFFLKTEEGTIRFGHALAPLLQPGLVVWLQGDLGTGKTTFVRAVLRKLGFSGPIKSPTYTLVEVYVISRLYLYHFDFYRFNEPLEFEDASLGEYFKNETICFIEWAEKAYPYVPKPDLIVALEFATKDVQGSVGQGRILTFKACSEVGLLCLNSFKNRESADASY